MIAQTAFEIFYKSIEDYHIYDSIDNEKNSVENYSGFNKILYSKNWIDSVQWHCEDIIRDPQIDANKGMLLKRRIDALNQTRTDLVEQIDDYFISKYKSVEVSKNAILNTESPAWAIDRLSILALKIYHMSIEASRSDSSIEYQNLMKSKLDVLKIQKMDLISSIDTLLLNISQGNILIKVYRQMKMYNDNEMNPILRNSSSRKLL